MARVLLVGGSRGFGLLAAQRLSAAGHHLVQVHRSDVPVPGAALRLDRRDEAAMRRALARADPDWILDNAAYDGPAVTVLRAMCPDAVYTLVSTAAVHWSGPLRGKLGDYIQGKRDAERAAGPSARVLRIGMVLTAADPEGRLEGFRQGVVHVRAPEAMVRVLLPTHAAHALATASDWPAGTYEITGPPRSLRELASACDVGIQTSPGAKHRLEQAQGLPPAHLPDGGPGWAVPAPAEWLPDLVVASRLRHQAG